MRFVAKTKQINKIYLDILIYEIQFIIILRKSIGVCIKKHNTFNKSCLLFHNNSAVKQF